MPSTRPMRDGFVPTCFINPALGPMPASRLQPGFWPLRLACDVEQVSHRRFDDDEQNGNEGLR
jgi:hypothetical protein